MASISVFSQNKEEKISEELFKTNQTEITNLVKSKKKDTEISNSLTQKHFKLTPEQKAKRREEEMGKMIKTEPINK